MPILRLACCVLLVPILALCGCGEPPADPWEAHGGDANAAVSAGIESMMKRALAFDLDDAKLGELLEIHREVLALGDDVRAAMARGAGTEWDAAAYNLATMKWEAMQEAAKKGAEGVQREIDEWKANRASLEKRLAEATGERKVQLQQQMEQSRGFHQTFLESLEAVQRLATPENAALVRKWKPRFDALEREFD